MRDITETLRIMASNIDDTRPEYDYSLAHKRVDDADIEALREAADLIKALRKANSGVMATGIKSVRDTAELAIELREVKAKHDKMEQQLAEFRECFANLAKERDLLWEDLERVTKERGEARREVCKREESASCLSDGEPTTTASDYARWCGWDCFKEDKPCQ